MKRFNIVPNGYDINEVNEFINVVINKLETLNKDNNYYLKEIENLKKRLESKENENNTKVSRALIAAQETTDKMKELAHEEANLIIREARENANAIIHEALIDASKKQSEFEILKKDYNVYKKKIESLVKAQLELLNDKNS